MNTLSFNVNNSRTLELVQRRHDGDILIINKDLQGNHETIPDNEAFIPTGDMVMLINYYRYIKRNNIQCDFINPNGKKVR
jgi:hypothetical protein